MAGVFISYRRTDGGGWAGRLNDHLALRFGANLIWQDVENLEAGKDLTQAAWVSFLATRIHRGAKGEATGKRSVPAGA